MRYLLYLLLLPLAVSGAVMVGPGTGSTVIAVNTAIQYNATNSASQQEVTAGTSSTKFVSPATLAGNLGATTAMVGDGVTDNTVAFSNLLQTGYARLPLGTFVISNVVIANNPVTLVGSGTLKYVGDHTLTALALNGASNFVQGVTFDFGKAMGLSVSNGIALNLNPVGGSTVSGVTFRNMPGIGVHVIGDSDIDNRSNKWVIANCTFDRVASPIRGAQTNRSEFGLVTGNRMNDYCGTAIFFGSANCLATGNSLIGYLTTTNSYPEGTGYWLEPSLTGSDPGRCHSIFFGNAVAHNSYDVRILNCTGGGWTLCGNNFGGGAASVVSNTVNGRIVNNLFNPYSRVQLTNNTALTFANNQVSGTIIGTNNGYMGYGNYNGSGNYFASDKVQAGKFQIENVGSIEMDGTDFFKLTKWSGGYGQLNADVLRAQTSLQVNNSGSFQNDSSDTFKLTAWSSGNTYANLKLGWLYPTNITLTGGNVANRPASTNFPGAFLQITNAGTKYFIPLYQ